MTPRIEHALKVGFYEIQPGKTFDPDSNVYWKHCSMHQQPCVRIKRRRGRYLVEADIHPARTLSVDLQRQAVRLLQSESVNPENGRYTCGSVGVSYDSVAPEHAHRLAAELFQLVNSAPTHAYPWVGNDHPQSGTPQQPVASSV